MKPQAITATSQLQPVTSASALSSTTPPATRRAETSSTGSGNENRLAVLVLLPVMLAMTSGYQWNKIA